MNNHIQVTLKSSTIEMNLNSPEESIYLVPELEGLTTLPEIRTSSGVNAGADGGWTSAQLFDARLISMRLVIANEDIAVVESKRRLLNTLLAQGRNEELALNITTEAGNAYTVNVRVTSVSASLDRVLHRQDFLIQFRADDPLIYGSTEGGGVEAILNVQKALGGFAIPFTFPLAIGGGSDGTVVQNVGTETVYPIITLYGNLHSPTVINRTTNQQLQIIADLASDIIWGQSQTAQGEYISITNELDIPAKLASVEMLGKAEQTTYSGKNLFDYASASDTANTTVSTYRIFEINGLVPSTTYTLSNLKFTSGINGKHVYLWSTPSYPGDPAPFIEVPGDYRNTLQHNSNSEGKMYLAIYPTDEATWNELIPFFEKAQLELGSTATAYEPYVGGTPAPNPEFPMPISVVTGENVVKIEGKNLWSPDNAQAFVTAVNVSSQASIETYDGRNCLRWQSHAGYGSYPTKNLTLEVKFRENTQYTISYDLLKTGARNRTLAIYYTDGTTTTSADAQTTDTWEHYTITSTAGKTIAYIAPWYTTGTSYIDINSVQIELGSTATAYEPYQGQEFEVNLGKNLLDPSATIQGVWNNASNTTTCTFFTPIYTGESFTISNQDTATWRFSAGLTTNPTNNPAGTGSQISAWQTGASYTITAQSDGYLWVQLRKNANTAITPSDIPDDVFMVERGTQASSFSPYFTPIELVKVGDYQDRIYKSEGKWYVEKQTGKVVLDGSESWARSQSGTTNLYAYWLVTPNPSIPNWNTTTPAKPKLCDHFTYKFEEWKSVTSPCLCENSGLTPNMCIFSGFADITTIADWQSWLSTHNTIVYYALATPTTTEITNETLIAQLDALESASLYLGLNNIGTETLNAVPTLDIGYYTSYEKQTDVVVIDSQANTITLNGLDIYNLMAEGSEFIEIAPGDNIMLLTSTQTSDDGYAEVKYKQGYLSI